jgi:hypothetical protein
MVPRLFCSYVVDSECIAICNILKLKQPNVNPTELVFYEMPTSRKSNNRTSEHPTIKQKKTQTQTLKPLLLLSSSLLHYPLPPASSLSLSLLIL